MRILVTGGAGYIGSVLTEQLLSGGYYVVVYDNLCKGHLDSIPDGVPFVEGNLSDVRLLVKTLADHGLDGVIHMAAYSLVAESTQEPEKYYRNNLTGGLSLLQAMIETGVKSLVFSSTAAIFGEPQKQPIEEGDPVHPTNPYGETKLAFERALQWYAEAGRVRYVSLRYFNAAGATERCGEAHEPETHLIPLVLEVAAGRRQAVEVFGTDYPTRDGTCVRDYIHVSDLARAHVMALGILDARSSVYNLGCGGQGYTVREVIDVAMSVTGRNIPVKFAPRRPGDPAILIASSRKITEELGWKPALQTLETIIASAWEWMTAHPRAYIR
jgi:UDP-glucose 4-epimerase